LRYVISIRKFFGAAVLVVIVSGPARAQNVSWTGYYFGGHAGAVIEDSGSWKNSADVISSGSYAPHGPSMAQSATSTFSNSESAFAAGIQGGYNYQVAPQFVIGFEADIEKSFLKSSGGTTVTAPVPGNRYAWQTTAAASRQLTYLGTVRSRVGYVVSPSILLFATGGLAYGGTKTSASFSEIGVGTPSPPLPSSGSGSANDTMVGYTFGGGLEWMLGGNWSARAEYLYYDLGSKTVSSSPLATDVGPSSFCCSGIVSVAPKTRVDYNGSDVRFALSYHFN